MELIRKLHDSLIPKSKLIIFCDGKILYDHTQNDYFFEINDLNPLDNYSPYLSIANDNSLYIYVIEVSNLDQVLGLFMDPRNIEFVDFRYMLEFLEPRKFKLVARALILNNWKKYNKFCSICGIKNKFNHSEGAFDCNCSSQLIYPSISPCVITLIHNDNQILLGRSKFFPTNMYSTLAGFIEAGESAEEALLREIKEEVNITVTDIKYFQSQSWPFPSQLMLGYFCKYTEGEIKLNDGELEDANWFELNDLPIIPPETSISGQLIRSYILDHSKL